MKLAGRYRLLNPLGEGTVRLAFDEVAHRDVAIRDLRARPADEARRALGLRHPSIVPLLDLVVADGGPWLITEFVSGASLERTVDVQRPLPELQAARAGLCLLEALTTAHDAGIVHGNLNPGKVMLTATGRAVLTGFGLPHPGLRPPADLWSLAATLHFAVEGRPPGAAPAEGPEPLRALIRAMLDPAGPPPLDTITSTLTRLALNHPITTTHPGPWHQPPQPGAPAEVPPQGVPTSDSPPPQGPASHGAPLQSPTPEDATPQGTPLHGPNPQGAPPQGPIPQGAHPQSPASEGPASNGGPGPSAEHGEPGYPLVTVGAPPPPKERTPLRAGLRKIFSRRRDDAPSPDPAEPGIDRALDQVIGTTGPLPPVQVAAIGLAVLDQLVALHARGEHHGDIRPGTILLSPTGQAILVPPLMPTGISAYTAPEGSIGPAADLWSLGATLFAAVEGLPPAPGAPLTRAGALAPLLYALLSGDPAARPAPAPLRQDLLAVAQS